MRKIMNKIEKRRQSKINKRNNRQKNRVKNKKSFDVNISKVEKVTILPDGTWKHKDSSEVGGKVCLEYEDGTSYHGGLNEDFIPDGKGTFTSKNGVKYEGEYLDGTRHGEGKITFSDGGTMEGSWKNGKLKGKGCFDLPKVGKFVGELEDASPKKGRIIFPDGIQYEGEFRDWNPNGCGEQIFPDGEKYIGDFKDGKYNGLGTYYLKNGHTMWGKWKDNKPDEEDYMFYWDSYPFDPKLDSCLYSKGGEVFKVSGENFQKTIIEKNYTYWGEE